MVKGFCDIAHGDDARKVLAVNDRCAVDVVPVKEGDASRMDWVLASDLSGVLMYALIGCFGKRDHLGCGDQRDCLDSSFPKTSPRIVGLFTGVGPIVILSPISKILALPIHLMTAWQMSGWQSVVKSISCT